MGGHVRARGRVPLHRRARGHPLGGTVTGTDALIAYAETSYRITQGRARHWNANTVIEGDGETATMRCYMLNLTAGAGKVAGTTGIYEDRLRKVDGGVALRRAPHRGRHRARLIRRPDRLARWRRWGRRR